MIIDGREVIIKESTVNHDVIIALHGGLGNPATFQSKIEQYLPEATIIYPSADATGVWKAGGYFGESFLDVHWLSEVINTLRPTYPMERLFLLGHSNGGAMAYRASQELQLPFSGIIALASSCFVPLQRITPTLHLHGADDNIVPVDGNSNYPPITNITAQVVIGCVKVILGAGHSIASLAEAIDLKREIGLFVSN